MDMFHVCRAVASGKHENFVMSTSYTARAGRRQTTRSTLLMYVVHLGLLKAPRKAVGQMDLLTCSPSLPPTMALTVRSYRSRRLYQPPLATAKAISIPQRQTRASSPGPGPARDAHGAMPNSRHVPSREQRSTYRENALCKGFETIMT